MCIRDSDIGMYSISYTSFVLPLVKAVQELDNTSQQSKDDTEDINTKMKRLKMENKALKKRLAKIEKILMERK